jgi:2-keto-3-deoxy-L-rhamnonate aldolase RhmA
MTRRLVRTNGLLMWVVSMLLAGVRPAAAQYQAGPPLLSAEVTENPVKRALQQGKVVLGSTVLTASPDAAATLAGIGFDFLWIEMEHSPLTLETVRSIILATRGLKGVPFTRVPVNQPWLAKRVLDIGSLGVIFPFVSTREAAEQAVKACRYPPTGIRGYGPSLAAPRWGLSSADYVKFANEQVIVVVIVEQKEAIDHVEEIAAVPGLDVLFFGANDMSFSLGVGGRLDHPLVEEAGARILAAGRKHGVAVGYPASSPAEIQKRIAQGFRFFQTANDLGLMSAGARDLLSKVTRSEPDKAVPR